MEETIKYLVNASIADNLKSLLGKQVYVTLDSGKTFAGFVKEVGNHLLHLEKLQDKDYFDALIKIENISAIDTRFRGFQS
jgi:small nuclear ribonucleoprotein (snRNP)-like protein